MTERTSGGTREPTTIVLKLTPADLTTARVYFHARDRFQARAHELRKSAEQFEARARATHVQAIHIVCRSHELGEPHSLEDVRVILQPDGEGPARMEWVEFKSSGL